MKAKLRLSLLMSIFLVSCTHYCKHVDKVVGDFKHTETHPELQPYVDDFEKLSGMDASHIPVNFEDIEGTPVGTCKRNTFTGRAEISVDTKWYNTYKYNQWAVEQLIFHELGHCLLLLDHDEKLIVRNGETIWRSIMYPYVFGYDRKYRQYREYYIDELLEKENE